LRGPASTSLNKLGVVAVAGNPDNSQKPAGSFAQDIPFGFFRVWAGIAGATPLAAPRG